MNIKRDHRSNLERSEKEKAELERQVSRTA